jgi:hypothetical protein
MKQGTPNVVLQGFPNGTFTRDEIRGYKIYSALLTQSGTDNPVAVVLENTIGGDIVWTRDNQGIYLGTTSALFDIDKTVFICGQSGYSSDGFTTCFYNSTSVVTVNTFDSTFSLNDQILGKTLIEIRVYP